MQNITLSFNVMYNSVEYDAGVQYSVTTADATQILAIQAAYVASTVPSVPTPPPTSLYDVPYDAQIKAFVAGSYAPKASPTFTGTVTAAALAVTGAFSANGAFKQSVSAVLVAATTLLTTSAYVQRADATAAARTITLPTAVGNTGLSFLIKKIDASANVVTVACNGAQTIEGSATKVLSAQWASVNVMSDGANWLQV